jgi:MtN3 and saliva related transmembrane protein
MVIADILGWTATVIFSLMLIPQIIKTVKTKTVDGVSLLLFVSYLIGNIIAVIYAYLIKQPPLIIKYWIAIVTSITYLFYYFKIKGLQNEIKS